MMDLASLLVFTGALSVAAASPGPGIAAIVARVLGGGMKGAIAFTAGVALGDVVWLTFAVLGLAVVAQPGGDARQSQSNGVQPGAAAQHHRAADGDGCWLDGSVAGRAVRACRRLWRLRYAVPSKDFKTHYAWLPAGRWGLESVANLDKVPPRGATLVVGAPKIKGATGGPTRVLALI